MLQPQEGFGSSSRLTPNHLDDSKITALSIHRVNDHGRNRLIYTLEQGLIPVIVMNPTEKVMHVRIANGWIRLRYDMTPGHTGLDSERSPQTPQEKQAYLNPA